MFYNLKLFLRRLIPRRFILLTHWARGAAAAFYYGFPAKKIRVIGVVGTKGKTTTVNLIAVVLEKAGFKVAMFSTANTRLAGKESLNTVKLTTPSPFFLQNFLRNAAEKACDYAVLEVSSHALIQYRLFGIDFGKIVITNLMPDHLDYHKNADEYRDVHLKMIGPKTKVMIVNGEDREISKLSVFDGSAGHGKFQISNQTRMLNVKILSFGIEGKNNLQGCDIQLNRGSVKFKVEYQGKDLGNFVLNMPGKFNVYNALAAISLGASLDIEPDIIKKALICVRGVPGRLENIKVSDKQNFEVIVDYAHSPDSLKNVYEAIKPYAKNRLIAVLGGTGDRDKTYRARAGALADQYADVVIITNEDPYSEDPEIIMDQALSGVKNKVLNKNLFRILDRKKAIKKAVDLAQENDIILITGKGSEQYMVWGDKMIPWDDREKAREALREKFKEI